MMELSSLAAIAATFLLAGTVKGVIGLGLPTVSLAVLALLFDLPTAMALLLAPSFATNLWQALVGGNLLSLLRRLWPFLAIATVMVWVGILSLTRVDLALLTSLLGVTLIVYAGANLAGLRFSIPEDREKWLGPLAGLVNGLLAGMTGSFVVPGVLYLQALGLPRMALVQAMGILFTLSTVALAIGLQGSRLLNADLGMLSLAAVVPALVGMKLGQLILARLSEQIFRRVFFISVLILGGFILLRPIILA